MKDFVSGREIRGYLLGTKHRVLLGCLGLASVLLLVGTVYPLVEVGAVTNPLYYFTSYTLHECYATFIAGAVASVVLWASGLFTGVTSFHRVVIIVLTLLAAVGVGRIVVFFTYVFNRLSIRVEKNDTRRGEEISLVVENRGWWPVRDARVVIAGIEALAQSGEDASAYVDRERAVSAVRYKYLTAVEEGATREDRERFDIDVWLPREVRFLHSYDNGGFWVLVSDRQAESTDRPNQACIPSGRYRVSVRVGNGRFAHGGLEFEFTKAPGGHLSIKVNE